jgi:mRNA interferase RelE/StbE
VEKYKILISNSAEKSLKKIPKRDLQRITREIHALSLNPFPAGCRKLSGEDHVYRVRVGTYRIIYEIDGGELIIWVLKVGHRKEVYR